MVVRETQLFELLLGAPVHMVVVVVSVEVPTEWEHVSVHLSVHLSVHRNKLRCPDSVVAHMDTVM